MKKRTIFYAICGIFGYMLINGYAAGVSGNYTGVHGASNTGCGSTNTCHGNKESRISVSFVMTDSVGTPMLYYKPGHRHIIKMYATHSTGNNWPKFGFQVSVAKGSGASYVQAGSFLAASIPANTTLDTTVNPYLWQQRISLSPSSGTGSVGTLYTPQITWIAPPAGSGDVDILGVACLVDDNRLADTLTDRWNSKIYTIHEMDGTGIGDVTSGKNFAAWPVPAAGELHLTVRTPVSGSVSLRVFSLNGACVLDKEVAGENINTIVLDLSGLALGQYTLVISNGGAQQVIPFAKQ